jgi:hypothetical protein
MWDVNWEYRLQKRRRRRKLHVINKIIDEDDSLLGYNTVLPFQVSP